MFKMTFDFNDRELTDLEQVNTALSALRFSNVEMENSDGYLATTTTYDAETQRPKGITYNYGFDHLELACERDEGDELHTWQVDTQAFPKGEVSGSDEFHDIWCGEYPNRAVRTLMQYSFKEADAFVVLYHEK